MILWPGYSCLQVWQRLHSLVALVTYQETLTNREITALDNTNKSQFNVKEKVAYVKRMRVLDDGWSKRDLCCVDSRQCHFYSHISANGETLSKQTTERVVRRLDNYKSVELPSMQNKISTKAKHTYYILHKLTQFSFIKVLFDISFIE